MFCHYPAVLNMDSKGKASTSVRKEYPRSSQKNRKIAVFLAYAAPSAGVATPATPLDFSILRIPGHCHSTVYRYEIDIGVSTRNGKNKTLSHVADRHDI